MKKILIIALAMFVLGIVGASAHENPYQWSKETNIAALDDQPQPPDSQGPEHPKEHHPKHKEEPPEPPQHPGNPEHPEHPEPQPDQP